VVSHSAFLKDVKRRGNSLSEGCTLSNTDHCVEELATWDTFFVRGLCFSLLSCFYIGYVFCFTGGCIMCDVLLKYVFVYSNILFSIKRAFHSLLFIYLFFFLFLFIYLFFFLATMYIIPSVCSLLHRHFLVSYSWDSCAKKGHR